MDLAVVVAAAPERAELLVGEMLDELAQSRIGAEEVLADVGAVGEEAPDSRARGVLHAAVGEVAIEARLVDGLERSEAHGYRREFPEIGHEPWVRIRRQALLERLAAEVVEISLAEPPFEEGPGVDAGAGVTLEEDLVARGAVVLAAEE